MIENISSDFPKVIPIVRDPLKYKIKFEERFEISEDKSLFPHSPNIDIVIETGLSDIAIESKFTEPYGGRKHEGLKQKYMEDVSFGMNYRICMNWQKKYRLTITNFSIWMRHN